MSFTFFKPMQSVIFWLFFTVFLLPITTWAAQAPPNLLARPIPNLTYTLQEQAPHPAHFFTQGLIFHQGYLFETSGLYGRSLIARYTEKSAKSASSRPITQRFPSRLFAEGLTRFKDRFFVLTWKRGEAWEMDNNWQRKQVWKYDGEGWGLTHNGKHLILSDGSDQLRFYDQQFKLQHTLTVTGGNTRWDRLNELEFVDGIIYANRWFDNHIIAIDSHTGKVVGTIDLNRLSRPHQRNRDHVLNGIAWQPDRKGFWITGKMWDKRYFITLDQQPKLAVSQTMEK